MPSVQQFIEIYKAKAKRSTDNEIAILINMARSTIERALHTLREIEHSIDVQTGEVRSPWKSPSTTQKNALMAIERIVAERVGDPERAGKVRQVAIQLSSSINVPLARDVLEPGSSVWQGNGLTGPIEQEPELLIQKEPNWRLFDEEMSMSTMKSLAQFSSAMSSYGRSIKAMHRKFSSNLPKDLNDPDVVRYPTFAKEAVVVSMMHWFAQSHDDSETFASWVDTDNLSESGGVTTVRLRAWSFDMSEHGKRGESAGKKLVQEILDESQSILKSIQATRFKDNYNKALDAAESLRIIMSEISSA